MNMNTVKETIDLKTQTTIDINPSKSDSIRLKTYEFYDSEKHSSDEELERCYTSDEYDPHLTIPIIECTQHYMRDWVKDRIKKRIDDHGEINLGEREGTLNFIYKRINTNISQEARDELVGTASILMSDSEEYRRDFIEKHVKIECDCGESYMWYLLAKNMYKPDSVC